MRWIFRQLPVRHYVTIGEREHLKPNPDFAGSIYLRYNPDVRIAGIPPFLHYVEIGHRELRVIKELPEPVPSLLKAMPRVGSGEPARGRESGRGRRRRRPRLLPRALGRDRRPARRLGDPLRPLRDDHRQGRRDRRAPPADPRPLPQRPHLALSEPRPRRAALRPPRQRRRPRRLPGGLQDPHQALAPPRGRRHLAAPPDRRHPARGLHDDDARPLPRHARRRHLGRRRPALPLARLVGLERGAGGADARPRRDPPPG